MKNYEKIVVEASTANYEKRRRIIERLNVTVMRLLLTLEMCFSHLSLRCGVIKCCEIKINQ
jgi:hypothetical protein